MTSAAVRSTMQPMRAVLSSLLVALALLAACRSAPLPEPVRLTLPRADDGRPWSFQERKGEATIVYFFATWCVYCQAMDPFVAEAARRGKAEGIEVVAIALDLEGARTVRPWVAATRPPYPVLLGGGAVAEGRSPLGRIPELPAVMFLDGEGRPAAVLTGIADTEMLLSRALEVRDRTR